MARKLNDLIRGNPYLNSLSYETACEKVYTLLAGSIRKYDFARLTSFQLERIEFYKISTTSSDDIYVSKHETPDKCKCRNLILVLEIALKENVRDRHTGKWTTIRDFWYRVQRRASIKGNSDVEKVLDPIARLTGKENLFHLLNAYFSELPLPACNNAEDHAKENLEEQGFVKFRYKKI